MEEQKLFHEVECIWNKDTVSLRYHDDTLNFFPSWMMGLKDAERRPRIKWFQPITDWDCILWYISLDAYIEDGSEYLEGHKSILYTFDRDKRICYCNNGGVWSIDRAFCIELRQIRLSKEEEKQVRKWSWGEDGVNGVLQYGHEFGETNNIFPVGRRWWINRRENHCRESVRVRRQELCES